MGAFHSTTNSRNSGLGSEWNSHFPEFHFKILGVPREVGLKFWKIGIAGKLCSIRPFLVPRVSHLTAPKSSLWGGKMRDPGNEVGLASQTVL